MRCFCPPERDAPGPNVGVVNLREAYREIMNQSIMTCSVELFVLDSAGVNAKMFSRIVPMGVNT